MSFLSNLFQSAKPLSLAAATDWHCHILPGVDDGVDNLEESLAILGQYEQAGYKTVWLTPHIMEDVPNTTERLRRAYERLQQAYTGPIQLRLAAENMLDSLFSERLEAGDVLPIGNSNTLLVETSYFSAPYRFHQTLDKIKSKGYFPLLAHPERYNYINDMRTYRELKDKGVRFQMNLLSLCGHYGPMVKEKAIKLLNAGMIDHCGTDLHRREHIEIIRTMKLPSRILDKLEPLLRP